MKSWAYNLTGILVGVFFLYLAVRKVDLAESVRALGTVNLYWLLAAVAVYLSAFPVRAIRWQRILRGQKALSFGETLVPVMVGHMATHMLPARVGELYRAHFLGRRSGMSRSGVVGSIVVERTLDGLMLVATMLLVFLLFPKTGLLGEAALLSGLLFVGLAVGILLYGYATTGTHRLVDRVLALLPRPLGDFIGQRLRLFLGGVGGLSEGGYLQAGACTVLIWACEAAAEVLVIASFGLVLPLTGYLLVFSLTSLSSVLPSGPGYVGPYQYAFVLGLGFFEVSKETALAVSVVAHFSLLGSMTVIGLALLWREQLLRLD